MANKRDVELAIRATDSTGQSFAAVSRAVADLTTKLAKQTEGAAKGETTTRELAATLRQLMEAGNALANQNATIELYKKLVAQFETASEKAAKARTAFETLKATQAGLTTVTAAQERNLASLGRSADRLAEAQTKAGLRSVALGEALERSGVGTRDLVAADEALLAVSQAVGTARVQAQAALDGYDASMRRHKAEVIATAAAEKAAAQANLAAGKAVAASWEESSKRQVIADKAAEVEAQRLLTVRETAARVGRSAAGRPASPADREQANVAAIQRFDAALKSSQTTASTREYVEFWERALSEQLMTRVTAGLKAQAGAMHDVNTAQRANVGGAKAGSSGGPSFLGLKPYELQNLSYQVNDVITQLSSGIKVTQVLAQQGGQVFQIFERQLGNLISILPQLAVAALVIGTIAAAIVRAANTAASIREFSAQLKLSVDGTNYSAAAVVKLQRELQRLGVDFDEAGKGLREFIKVGVRQDQFIAFGLTAERISRIMGTTFPEAAKQLSEAFTGNYEAIVKLDTEYNFLDVAQRKAIKAMFDSGNAAGGQAAAFKSLEASVQSAARMIDGPFTQSWRTLKVATFDFLDLIANGPLMKAAVIALQGMAGIVSTITNGIRAVVDILPGGGGVANDPKLLQAAVEKLQRQREYEVARPAPRPVVGLNLTPGAGESAAVQATRFAAVQATVIAEIDAKIVSLTKRMHDLDPTTIQLVEHQTTGMERLAEATEARRKAGDILLVQQAKEIAAHKGLNDAARVAAAGLDAYNKVLKEGTQGQADTARRAAAAEELRQIGEEHRAQAESLAQELAALASAGGKAQKDSLDAQLKAIDDQYQQIRNKLEDFQRHGGGDGALRSVTGKSIAEFKAEVEANKEYLKQQAEVKYFETGIGELVADRSAKFAELLERIKDGTLSAKQGYDQAIAYNAKISPQLADMAKKALEFARALNTAHPSPQLEAFISRTERALDSEGGGRTSPVGKFAEHDSAAGLEHINELTRTRNDLAKSYDELAKKGTITQREANSLTEKAYKQLTPDILKAADAMDEYVMAQEGAGKSSAQLDLVKAKLKEIRAEAEYVNPEFLKLANTIENAFADRAIQAFDAIGASIGKAIAGTQKWGQTFKDIGLAIGSFFTGLMADIAKAIIKEEALALIKSLFIHEGGVVGGADGGMSRSGISPAAWIGAPRYHGGAVVGLGADEQAAVLKNGEEVLTGDDPRNIMNIARQGASRPQGGATNIRSVLVLDEKLIPQAMSSSHGEEVTMSHIKANIPTIRAMMGGRK